MGRNSVLSFVLPFLVAGCFLQPDNAYYEIELGGAWVSNDSMVSCAVLKNRSSLSFADPLKISLTTKYPSYVAVMEGKYTQNKATLSIEWDTASGCWIRECDLYNRIPQSCSRIVDTASIERSGKIVFRNDLYSRLQL